MAIKKRAVLPVLLKAVFSLAFLILLYQRISIYPVNLLKFSFLSLISQYNLSWLFYVLGVLELALAVGIWFTRLRWMKMMVDVSLLAYIPWLLAYYIILYNESGGCIECNYTTHFLGENILQTTIGMTALGLMYLFYLRDITE